jgi:hypothetical protein
LHILCFSQKVFVSDSPGRPPVCVRLYPRAETKKDKIRAGAEKWTGLRPSVYPQRGEAYRCAEDFVPAIRLCRSPGRCLRQDFDKVESPGQSPGGVPAGVCFSTPPGQSPGGVPAEDKVLVDGVPSVTNI